MAHARDLIELDDADCRRRNALTRSSVTLVLFAIAMVLSLKTPLLGFELVTCVLLTYMRPELPGTHRNELP